MLAQLIILIVRIVEAKKDIGLSNCTNPDERGSKIERSICDRILQRADVGKAKYGVTMEREDLSPIQWLRHAQEEALDLAVYLEKIIEVINTKDK